MMEYSVEARRIDGTLSVASAKQASVNLDTDMRGRQDAFNPVELLLAALAACIIKGIERVSPMLDFAFEGVEVKLKAVRQDAPPKLTGIVYELIVDTQEDDRRLELLHTNVRKYGTISNTLALAVELSGSIRRA
jgi:uncharacterized OsmC-like protein